MKFRPCIDIHNGKVKQIVGASLKDAGNYASENFISEKNSRHYALMFKEDGIKGAHVIILNSADSEYFEATKEAAVEALAEYPDGLEIGGGINDTNASFFIEKGASHVIVTSFLFEDGRLSFDRLNRLKEAVGREHIVIDLSAREREGEFYVVTNRWQSFTDVKVCTELFEELSEYCDEFLIHGVDVEGKRQGVNEKLIRILSEAAKKTDNSITYAGGISTIEDIELIGSLSEGKLDFTVGSALDLYGGALLYKELVEKYR